MTRYFMRLVIGTFVFMFLTSASVFGMEVYIPHITGGYDNWSDYLLVDNSSVYDDTFDLVLFDQGSVVYSDTWTVFGLSGSILDLKSLAPTAECGVIMNGSSRLSFRLAYNNLDAGGVAEFQLTGELNTILSFNFSDFNPNISWKGIALANFDDATASVDLYAVGYGGILGQNSITVGPNTRVLGTHDVFFPSISFGDIQRIIVVSSTGLCGVTISGSTNNSLLIFTSGASLLRFDSADPYPYNLVMTEKLQGRWYFEDISLNSLDELYDLNYPAQESIDDPGVFYIPGFDNDGGLVEAAYRPYSGDFNLIEYGPIFDKFYILMIDPENEVFGCYFEVQGDDWGICYSIKGSRIHSQITSGGSSLISAVKSMKGSDTGELQQPDESALRELEESQELGIESEVDQDLIDLYHRLKDIHNQRSNESTP